MDNYIEIIENAKVNGNWFRLGKTFRTREDLFFLDTGTGQVFKVKENIFRVLDCLFKTNNFDNLSRLDLSKEDLEAALREICEAITTKHLFSAPLLSRSNITGQHLKLEENLKGNMSSLTLELTERCNLRCKYCIYGENNSSYRSFGEKDMSLETAQKSIDFLMEHSQLDKMVYIGLYGGEPLLRYPIIKKIVEYVGIKYPQRKVSYSMTSNMTLMTEEIAEFLVSVEGMSVVVSLDGPEEVNDTNRVFVSGKGSFSSAISGFYTYMKLKEKSINKDTPTLFSTVISKPFSKEKFAKINEFFNSLRMNFAFSVLISYVTNEATPNEYIEINSRLENSWGGNYDENALTIDPLMVWTLDNLDTKNFAFNYFRKSALLEIHKRKISETPMSNYPLNGCCVPGARRLYVTATGNFLPCERVGTQLPIGNVNDGFYIDFIKKHYIDSFIEQEIKYCGECWAVNLCINCYMNCFGDDNIDFSYRHKMCSNTRKNISESLSIYHEVMARNPEMIEELNSVVIE